MQGDTDGPTVERWVAGDIEEADFVAACALHHRSFPKANRTLDDVLAKKRGVWMGDEVVPGPLVSESPPIRFVVRDGREGRVVANACTLVRRIEPAGGEAGGGEVGGGGGPLEVMGLFDVSSDPAERGRGLGELVTRHALARMGVDAPTVCLFQTGGARSFYERLGARVINNRFTNPLNADAPDASPFTDEVVMLYPGDAPWPDGPIDLRGPGW